MESRSKREEQQRRVLQEYIFKLEEAHDKAGELAVAHESLKRSQDLLLAILSSTIQGICLVKDRNIVWCNEGMTHILGWKQEELLGKSIRIFFVNSSDFKRIDRKIYAQSGGVDLISFEYDHLHKDGHRVPCLVTGRALDLKDPSKGYVFSLTDFTEKVKAREALDLSQTDLADRMGGGTKQHHVSAWEHGAPMSRQTVERICAALDCDACYDGRGWAFGRFARLPWPEGE